MAEKIKEIREKALQINLDPYLYGTIAEIGAGQEVSRQFFQAGGASGTIAKAISAYDKIVSDTIYGKEDSGRYVCHSRVIKMLKREYDQLITRLSSERDPETTFFAYADTVATTGYKSDQPGNGWLGVRFQHYPNAEFSQIILHVILKDKDALTQQYLMGNMGVNLIHACYYCRGDYSEFISRIMDHIPQGRVDLDMIETSGPAFKNFDNRLLSLELVKQQFTEAVFFEPGGKVFQPSEKLYKKNILILRGSFKPPTLVSEDMLKCGLEEYAKQTGAKKDAIVPLAEITMGNLHTWGDIDGKDFLQRVDLLGTLGLNVMISNHERHYRLSTYFTRVTNKPIAMVLGYYNIKELFNEEHYKDLEGGILQSFGVLFNHHDMLFCYPYQEEPGKLLGTRELEHECPAKLKFLFKHLCENGLVVELGGINTELLDIYSRKVLGMIANDDEGWEKMIPKKTAEKIKKNQMLGYKP